MKVIELKNIGKKYRVAGERKMLSKILLLGWLKRKKDQTLWALKNIEFQVNKGEVVGVIGENGSGKSTLLKILSGVTSSSQGMVKIKGRVSSLLELGAGFHPDLTGRENIYLNGSLLGLRRSQINEKIQEIIDFSGLQDFIDTPIKNYSSGMYLRLGFSVAMSVFPDILLIDEVLSVGDETFQRECIKKIKEFKDSGKTIVFVSHDLDMVLSLCDRVFLLNHGEIIKSGKPVDVVQFYLDTVGKKGVAILKKGPLDVIFNQGKFSLYWQGRKITKGLGGFSSILSAKRWYNSIQAEWGIKSKEPNKLVVQGKWLRLPVIQIWELDISKNNSLCWRIKTVVEQEDLYGQEQINLMLCDGYQEWFADNQKENFHRIQTNSIIWEELLLQELVVKSVGIRAGDLAQSPTLPSLCFETQDKDSKDVIKLFNSDYQDSARVLQCSHRDFQDRHGSLDIEMTFGLPDLENYIERKYEQKIKEIVSSEEELSCIFENNLLRVFWRGRELPEDYILVKRYIQNKLEAMRRREEEERKRREEKERKRREEEERKRREEEERKRREEEERKRREEERKRQELQEYTLQKGPLKLVFEDGRVRLFWKDIELTKGLGLYAAIYHSECWHLSTQAEWLIEKMEEVLILKGKFIYLPLQQIWRLKLGEGNNSIILDIDIIIEQPICIEQGSVGLMLTDDYKKWFTQQKQGLFPDIFAKEWVDILSIDPMSVYGRASGSYNFIPDVVFQLNPKAENNFVRISNTDFTYKSRVLQLLRFETQDRTNFAAGRYPYFSTTILYDASNINC